MEDANERPLEAMESVSSLAGTTAALSDAKSGENIPKMNWLTNNWNQSSLWWRRIRIRTTSYLSYRFGGFFIGLGFGIFGGLAIRLPLLPTDLFSEKLLSAVQSTAGAMVGAGLAGLLARMLIARTDVQFRQVVAKVIRIPASDFSQLMNWLEAPKAPSVAQAEKFLKELKRAAEEAIARLKLLSTSHAQITEGRGLAIIDAQLALEEYLKERRPKIEAILTKASENEVGPLATTSFSSNVPSHTYDWLATLKKEIGPTLTSLDSALLDLGLPRRNFISIYSDD